MIRKESKEFFVYIVSQKLGPGITCCNPNTNIYNVAILRNTTKGLYTFKINETAYLNGNNYTHNDDSSTRAQLLDEQVNRVM